VTPAFSIPGGRFVVTGGTGGLGRAISLQLARAGAEVLACYAHRDEAAQALTDLATAENLSVRTVRGDITSSVGRQRLLDGLGDKPLSGLVHCAATGVHREVAELTGRQFDFTFALNVKAFLELVQLLLPKLASGASVVALSSAGASRAIPYYSLIGASKGALESLCRHLAVELAPRGIRINVLSPGTVRTQAWEAFPNGPLRLDDAERRTPRGALVTPEEVAHVAQFLCSSASSGISGQIIVVDAGSSVVG
jgi:enoyl-[acyl-carrier protein] reductase III